MCGGRVGKLASSSVSDSTVQICCNYWHLCSTHAASWETTCGTCSTGAIPAARSVPIPAWLGRSAFGPVRQAGDRAQTTPFTLAERASVTSTEASDGRNESATQRCPRNKVAAEPVYSTFRPKQGIQSNRRTESGQSLKLARKSFNGVLSSRPFLEISSSRRSIPCPRTAHPARPSPRSESVRPLRMTQLAAAPLYAFH